MPRPQLRSREPSTLSPIIVAATVIWLGGRLSERMSETWLVVVGKWRFIVKFSEEWGQNVFWNCSFLWCGCFRVPTRCWRNRRAWHGHGGTFALTNICGEKKNDGNALFSSAFSYDLNGNLHGIVLDFWLYRFSGCFL